jgi:hypothetical protein
LEGNIRHDEATRSGLLARPGRGSSSRLLGVSFDKLRAAFRMVPVRARRPLSRLVPFGAWIEVGTQERSTVTMDLLWIELC